VEEAARHRAASVTILLREDPAYPLVLLEDLLPPPVLFVQGDLTAAAAVPRVAIVGTRRCTGAGAGVARSLGRELADAGVGVVSGLALGIDGAAHRGVLEVPERDGRVPGPPVAVIGCGHDRPYPARHSRLWHEVAARGVLLGEAPLGTRPSAWRFPARNG
jgi:DNA processing protein